MPNTIDVKDAAGSTVTVNTNDAVIAALALLAKLADTQPVSVASLPLPTGAATETSLAAMLAGIGLLAKKTDTQPVSAASLPLPLGAATDASLDALRGQGGHEIIEDTTAHTNGYHTLQVVSTQSSGDGSVVVNSLTIANGPTYAGRTLYAGDVIYGDISSIQLTSVSTAYVRAYIA